MQAAGKMGWTQDQFWFSTPRFFENAYFGWLEYQDSVMLANARNARTIAYFSYLPHTKKGSLKRPEDLYPLPGDKNSLEAIEARIAKERGNMADVLRIAKNIDFFKGETMPQA